VGRVTHDALLKLGIKTIGDLRCYPAEVLTAKFGEAACESLKNLAEGRDDGEVETVHETKSISREHTFQNDTDNRVRLRKSLLALADDVARRCRRHGLKGRTLFLTWREPDFQRHSRHRTLSVPTDESDTLVRTALDLFDACVSPGTLIRLIGTGIMNFGEKEEEGQLDLFAKPKVKQEQQARLDRARDAIRGKFGDAALKRASLL